MGLSSIKFMEINYGKNCTKRKRVRGLSIRASVKKKKKMHLLVVTNQCQENGS